MKSHTRYRTGYHTGTILFPGIGGHTAQEFYVVIVMVALLTILRTCLAAVRNVAFSPESVALRKARKPRCTRIAFHCLDCLMLLVDILFGYGLMLSFMSGNVWVWLTILVCSVISYLLSSWTRIHMVSRSEISLYRQSLSKNAKQKNGVSNSDPTHKDRGDLAESVPFINHTEEEEASRSQQADLPFSPIINNPDYLATFTLNPPNLTEKNVGTSSAVTNHSTVNTSRYENCLPPKIDVLDNPVNVSSSNEHNVSKDRSDSNPLLDKYPVLKFHNVNINSTSAPAEGFQMAELDQILKELQDQVS